MGRSQWNDNEIRQQNHQVIYAGLVQNTVVSPVLGVTSTIITNTEDQKPATELLTPNADTYRDPGTSQGTYQ